MNKNFLFAVFFLFTLILGLNSVIYASDIMPGGEYLENHQWGALEDILADWQTGKISTDECAIYGCYVLAAHEPSRLDRTEKAKLLPSKYKLDKKSVEEGPYSFVYQIYKIENSLDKKALDEFRNSEWSDYEFIENLTNNNKFIEIIQATQIESYDGKEYRNYNSILEKALHDKILMPETIRYQYWLALSGINIRRYEKYITPFQKKYKLMFKNNGLDCIKELFDKFPCSNNGEKHRKLSNVVHYLFYSRYKTGEIPEIYKDGFRVIGIGVDEKTIEKYCNWLVYYKTKMVSNGFKEPINFYGDAKKTLEVFIQNAPCPISGLENATAFTLATPADPENTPYIKTGCFISFYIPTINGDIKTTPPEKHVIHETMHSITYSYDNKKTTVNDYHWYLQNSHNDSYKCMRTFEEATTGWAEDYFYEGDSSYNKFSTIFKSNRYFFKNYNGGDLTFPASGMLGNGQALEEYGYGYFFKHLCRLFGNGFVKKLWETITAKKFTNSFNELMLSQNQKISDVLHDFAIRNFLLTKTSGVYPDEDIFSKSNEIWADHDKNFPVLKIRDDLLPAFTMMANPYPAIEVAPLSTKFVRLDPGRANYFGDSFTLDVSWPSGFNFKASVITAWTEVGNNDAVVGSGIRYEHTPLAATNNKAQYRYFTKKGVNPKYFVLALTNDGKEGVWAETSSASIDIILENPAPIPGDIATGTDNIVSAVAKGGKEFTDNMVSLYKKNDFQKMRSLQTQTIALYNQFINTSDSNRKEIIGRQVKQSLLDLKLSIDTTLTQVHDLRFQFYLWKNMCAESIARGGNAVDVTVPLKNLKDFLAKTLELYNQNTDKSKIYAFYGNIVGSHAYLKIAKIKAPFNWSEAENAINKDCESARKKLSSLVNAQGYPYWYTREELNESVSGPIVGMSEDEINNPEPPPPLPPVATPAMVNYCPNLRSTILKELKWKAGDEFFTLAKDITDINIMVSGQQVSANNIVYLPPEAKWKCDPLSLLYFSAVKKHQYHENNMPPKPTSSNVKEYFKAVGYYMNLCKNYSLFTESITMPFDQKRTAIKGSADRIAGIISALADAIIREKAENKTGLYDACKAAAAEVSFGDEALDLLEKQLKREGFRE